MIEEVLNEFLYWLRDEGWIKDDLLDQAVDITVHDFVCERALRGFTP